MLLNILQGFQDMNLIFLPFSFQVSAVSWKKSVQRFKEQSDFFSRYNLSHMFWMMDQIDISNVMHNFTSQAFSLLHVLTCAACPSPRGAVTGRWWGSGRGGAPTTRPGQTGRSPPAAGWTSPGSTSRSCPLQTIKSQLWPLHFFVVLAVFPNVTLLHLELDRAPAVGHEVDDLLVLWAQLGRVLYTRAPEAVLHLHRFKYNPGIHMSSWNTLLH